LTPVAEWPASAQRPPGYPEALPFVPDAAVDVTVDVTGDGGTVVMKWLGVERPADLVQQLVGACAVAGWRRTADPADPGRSTPRHVRFVAGEAERVIEAVHAGPFSFVMLTERRTSAQEQRGT
jgi:hypothetical protein